MAGQTLKELNFTSEILPKHYSVKEAVFPFIKFPGVDVTLGPEMRSTGEVMGIDADLGIAYAKAQMSAQPPLPTAGNVFISVKDSDKQVGGPHRQRVRRSRIHHLRDRRNGEGSRRSGSSGEAALQIARRVAQTSWI